MRKIVVAMVVLLGLAFSVQLASAGSDPVYGSGPTGFNCSFVQVTDPDDTIRCSWDSNLGAPKYSVSTIASYTLNPTGTASFDFSFSASTTTIDIPVSAFPADPDLDTDTDTLDSVVLRVKGLYPQRWKSQNNTFSPTITCTLSDTSCTVLP